MYSLKGAAQLCIMMVILLHMSGVVPVAAAVGAEPHVPVWPGIDVLLSEQLHLVAGKRVGLVTHAAGTDARLISSADRLYEHPDVTLQALFAPEHGIRGAEAHGAHIATYVDPVTGVTVYSLYGTTRKPTKQMLDNLDVVLIDLQGVGSYWYTYKFTMSYVIEAAIENNLPVIVLDRPNPLGGAIVEGPVMAAYNIWRHPIALRHGMTYGEIALMWNSEFYEGKGDITVVPMKGWQRDMLWQDTGLHWVLPSPNIPWPETALLYAGLALFENTNLSVGRGTTLPFHWFGGPGIDAYKVAADLNSRQLPGVLFRPVYFKPLADKLAGVEVGGVQVYIEDPHNYHSVRTAFHVADAFRRSSGGRFSWASGGPSRVQVMAGVPPDRIIDGYAEEMDAWLAQRAKYLLYD